VFPYYGNSDTGSDELNSPSGNRNIIFFLITVAVSLFYFSFLLMLGICQHIALVVTPALFTYCIICKVACNCDLFKQKTNIFLIFSD